MDEHVRTTSPRVGPESRDRNTRQDTSPSTSNTTSAKEAVRSTADDLKERAEANFHHYEHQAREKVREVAREQRTKAAEEVRVFGSALRQAAVKLEQEDDIRPAHYAARMANTIDGVAAYLERRDPELIAEDARGFIRRHPEAVIGGLFTVGLLAGRFLRASEPARPPARLDGYESAGGYGTLPREQPLGRPSSLEPSRPASQAVHPIPPAGRFDRDTSSQGSGNGSDPDGWAQPVGPSQSSRPASPGGSR